MKYEDWKSRYIDKTQKPKVDYVNFYDVARYRTVDEFKSIATKLKPEVESYVGRKSLWSGRIVLKSDCPPHKDWNCDIVLLPNATEYIVLHELIHSCSISHFGEEVFLGDNVISEELATHYLGQEIALKKGMAIIWSENNKLVDLIREFRMLLNVPKNDLEFAMEFIRQAPQDRWEFLEEVVAEKFTSNTTINEYQDWLNKLEELRSWRPKS